MQKGEWFENWFNSPYYHLLYNHRNFQEAEEFMARLCTHLGLKEHARIWDLACGKGRHAIALNRMGYDVIATDLSVNSIREAAEHSNPTLEFFVHDMRQPFKVNFFDAVFNLFTSIGYFSNPDDNYKVFENVALAMKPGTVFVIDFLNAKHTVDCLKSDYTEKRKDIDFHISKKVRGNSIVKRIEFSDQGHNYFFEECVSLLRKEDFVKFGNAAGLKLTKTFGNYLLQEYEENNSERLILLFTK